MFTQMMDAVALYFDFQLSHLLFGWWCSRCFYLSWLGLYCLWCYVSTG
jgi:hypothetical protein